MSRYEADVSQAANAPRSLAVIVNGKEGKSARPYDTITCMVDMRVLLIGGSSGVGKTTVATLVAARLGMTWASADDFRLVLQRSTTPAQQPVLHAFFRDLPYLAGEALAHRYIEVGRYVSYAIEIVIANHVATNAPIVLEGDTLMPEVAAQRVVADLDVGDLVRAVFIVEADADQLRQNILARGRGVEQLSSVQLARFVQFSWCYGQWLQQEAMRYGLPVVPARPKETLVDRLLAAIP
jgi:2-phosphoglycerate kinase